MATLIEKYVGLVTQYAIRYNLNSSDNKVEFFAMWDVVKVIPKEQRVEEVKLMKTAATAHIKLNSARREYNKLLTSVQAYALLPDRYINLTAISFENLSKTLRLVSRIAKHYDGDMTKLSIISAIWEHGMSAYRYNNVLEDKLLRVSEQCPALTTHKVTTEQALVYLDGVDIVVKQAMLERLLHDFGYSVSEVA